MNGLDAPVSHANTPSSSLIGPSLCSCESPHKREGFADIRGLPHTIETRLHRPITLCYAEIDCYWAAWRLLPLERAPLWEK